MKSIFIYDDNGGLLLHLKRTKTGVDYSIRKDLEKGIFVKIILHEGGQIKFGEMKNVKKNNLDD